MPSHFYNLYIKIDTPQPESCYSASLESKSARKRRHVQSLSLHLEMKNSTQIANTVQCTIFKCASVIKVIRNIKVEYCIPNDGQILNRLVFLLVS